MEFRRMFYRVLAFVLLAGPVLLACNAGRAENADNAENPDNANNNAAAAAEPEEKALSRGDSIVVTVKRHGDMDRVVTVGANGFIDFPLVGKLKVEGMTLAQVKENLTSALKEFIKNPEIDVNQAYGAASVTKIGPEEDVPKIIKIFPLKNSDSEVLAESLRGVVSMKGTITSEKSSNSLIVSDTEMYIEGISKIVKELDSIEKRTKQVLIEAEIIEVTITDARDLALEGFIQHVGDKDSFFGKYNKQIAMPTSINYGSGGNPLPNVTDMLLSQLGDGGNWFFGDIYGKHKYQMYVMAMVDLNKAKVIARPKIIVENNQKANIQIVTSYPYRELSGSGIVLGANSYVFTTKFIDYGILMPVIPHVKENGMINLEIEPEVSFIQGFSDGIPIRVARRASTQVNIANNGTLVIGGLINERTINTVKKVPVLGDIPVVGLFFKNQSRDTEKTELLIFVTPRLLDEPSTKDINEKAIAARERMIKFKTDSKPCLLPKELQGDK